MEANVAHPPPRVLSVVSGKGGVGKTAFSLSLAHELSDNGNSVVLIDTDFYNRGLSEIISTAVTSEQFSNLTEQDLKSGPFEIDLQFSVSKVTDNISFFRLAAFDSDTIAKFESLPLHDIQSLIRGVLHKAHETTNSNIVLLDCHGGPDKVSYACASLSDHVFVVSVPETITFFGTIRFLEGFSRSVGDARDTGPERITQPKTHLVFNMVTDKFRHKALNLWYRRYFRQYCEDDGLALVIPFDPRISIATANDPFPTRTWHYSLKSEKLRFLVDQVFGRDDRVVVSRECRFVSRYIGPFIHGPKAFLCSLVDERIPLRVLLTSLVMLLLCIWFMVFFWADESIFTSMLRVQNILDSQVVVGGILATYVWLFLVGSWLIYSFAARFLIRLDTEVSGKIRLVGIQVWDTKSVGRIVLCIFCIVFSIFYFVSSEMISAEFREAIDLAAKQFKANEATEERFGLILRFFESYLVVEHFIRWVIFGAFGLVFLVRTVRTMLFRLLSWESLYRCLVGGFGVGLLGFLYF